jgi:hypothetical protein
MAPAHSLTRARVLLDDNELEADTSMVSLVCSQRVKAGREARLSRTHPDRVEFACLEPLTGCERWTLGLLANGLDRQELFGPVACETGRRTLKEMRQSRG